MSRRKDAKANVDPHAEEALSELFVDSDDFVFFDFDLVELAPFGRVLTAVAALGGNASLYSRKPDAGIQLFVRVGERSKRYIFDNEDQWNEQIEMIANPWVSAWGKYLALKRPTKPIAIAPEKPPKLEK